MKFIHSFLFLIAVKYTEYEIYCCNHFYSKVHSHCCATNLQNHFHLAKLKLYTD